MIPERNSEMDLENKGGTNDLNPKMLVKFRSLLPKQ